VPVINGRDVVFNMVQDLADDEPLDPDGRHVRGRCPSEVMSIMN
jgi:hypothetical protein